MECLDPVYQARFAEKSSLLGHFLAEAPLNGAPEPQIVQAQILSGNNAVVQMTALQPGQTRFNASGISVRSNAEWKLNAPFHFPGYPNNDQTSGRNSKTMVFAFSARKRFVCRRKPAVKRARQAKSGLTNLGRKFSKPPCPKMSIGNCFRRSHLPSGWPSSWVSRREPGSYTVRINVSHGEKLMPHKHPEIECIPRFPASFISDWVMNSTRLS
jgi:hypothetical protein